MPKRTVEIDDFELEDDETEIPVIAKTVRKPQINRSKQGGTSRTVSVRVSSKIADTLTKMKVDVPSAFKLFCEELANKGKCPTCGQDVHKKTK